MNRTFLKSEYHSAPIYAFVKAISRLSSYIDMFSIFWACPKNNTVELDIAATFHLFFLRSLFCWPHAEGHGTSEDV